MSERNWTSTKVKALREKYDISQRAFAKIVGSSDRWQTISEWERDEFVPNHAHTALLNNAEANLASLWDSAGKNLEKFHRLLEKRYGIGGRKKGGRKPSTPV